MINELASFENALDRVHATEELLSSTLTFDPSLTDPSPKPGYAKTIILTEGDEVAGMALYFYNYSTWLASPGIYLEDLYVRPAFRRKGYATLLLKRLAEETREVSGGKGRLEWNCLRWNEGALKFYGWLGGQRLDEWVQIRVEGEGLGKMVDLKNEGGA